jgi:predicted amidohydrolase YtcJ
MTPSGADLVFVRGSIYPFEPESRREAVAIACGRILDVGSEDGIRELITPSTHVIDLEGRALLPGFNDAHVHPIAGGLERLRCDLTGCSTRAEYQDAIRSYADANPGVEWITGGGWSMTSFPAGTPTAVELDQAVADRPALLFNRDHHGAWVNSRALDLAGIDADTPDPPDGRIERAADGQPTGTLHEGATNLVEKLVPQPTESDLLDGLLEGQRYLHSLGITGWQDAIVGEAFLGRSTLPTYLQASGDRRLTARVRGALWLGRDASIEAVGGFLEQRAEARASGFDAGSIKIMQDGVVENYTAAMLEPYLSPGGTTTDGCGLSFFDPEFLNEFVPAADAAGFQLHFHAIGDRAVRECLDAVEAARHRNGMNDNRHHIAHIQVIHPDDVPRFGELGVVANAQPLWACMEAQMRDLTVPLLGPDRTNLQYPFASLVRSGARLAFGSDWPVSSADPLAGMHVAVTRTEAPSVASEGVTADPLISEEGIDLTSAIVAYTSGSAYVSHMESDTGTIERGKYADLAVLERAPAVGDIDGVRVDMTIVGGEIVFDRL